MNTGWRKQNNGPQHIHMLISGILNMLCYMARIMTRVANGKNVANYLTLK